jgi:glutaredoxin 2
MSAAARTIADDVLPRIRHRGLSSFGAANAQSRSKQKKAALRMSAEARNKVEYTIQHAWADSMLKKYGQSLEAFHHFCNTEGVLMEQRLPANEFLLCAFAASRVDEIAGSTARRAMVAVKAWHVINDAE